LLDFAADSRQIPTTATARSRSRAAGCLYQFGAAVLVAIVVFLAVQAFIIQPFQVQHESMRTTLEEGQYVLVDKLTPRFHGYSRGDIIVFEPVRREESCSGPAIPLMETSPYIKRVIGVAGDVIELRDGAVYVNGALLPEPYVHGLETGPVDTAWTVAPERVFVMGDNRAGSIDSRSDEIGQICVNDVVGRAVLRYWPPNRLGILQQPTYPEQ
jgi:signal peptidase I